MSNLLNYKSKFDLVSARIQSYIESESKMNEHIDNLEIEISELKLTNKSLEKDLKKVF